MVSKQVVLVTGASGFIGFHLCQSFLQSQYRVVGLSRGTKQNYSEVACHKQIRLSLLKAKSNFYHVEMDLENPSELTNVIRSFSPAAVFHFAAPSHLLTYSPSANQFDNGLAMAEGLVKSVSCLDFKPHIFFRLVGSNL